MPTIVNCSCGARFQAADHLQGRRVPCPTCGGPIDVPPLLGASDPGIAGGLGYAPGTNLSMTHDWTAAAATQPLPRTPASTHSTGSGKLPVIPLVIGAAVAFTVLRLVVIGSRFFRSNPEQVAQPLQQPEPFRSQQPENAPQPARPRPYSAGQPAQQASTGSPASDAPPIANREEPETANKPSHPAAASSGRNTGEGATRLSAAVTAWHGTAQQPLRGMRRAGDKPDAPLMLNYSWMTELLPHLGYQALYDKFDFSQSWSTDSNLQAAAVSIPEFLNPQDDRQRWSGYPYDGMPLTHFVGMAGLEMGRNDVAARLPRTDPRAGMFGYDQVAGREQIGDGTSHTLAIIGSGEIVAPWVQAGGATIRGAREPHFDRLTGFGSRGLPQPGAMAVFADGSVREISPDIDAEVFRAMCTINGGEAVDLSRLAR